MVSLMGAWSNNDTARQVWEKSKDETQMERDRARIKPFMRFYLVIANTFHKLRNEA